MPGTSLLWDVDGELERKPVEMVPVELINENYPKSIKLERCFKNQAGFFVQSHRRKLL